MVYMAVTCNVILGRGSLKKRFFSCSSDMPLADNNEAPPLHPSGWAPDPY